MESTDCPSSHTDILNTMQDVQRQYGSDAVMLEGHLLGQAVRSGAVGATTVSVGGIEERDRKRFLAFKVDTGIIYNDRDLSAAARPGHLWSEVVEASLRKFRTLSVPADGIAVTLSYAHRAYEDEAEARAHLSDQPGTPEVAAFYLLLSDLTDLFTARITNQQLIERSTVLLDGAPVHFPPSQQDPTP